MREHKTFNVGSDFFFAKRRALEAKVGHDSIGKVPIETGVAVGINTLRLPACKSLYALEL